MRRPIDLVLPWVDGSDPAWQKEKAKYTQNNGGDQRAIRYRDWGLLRYWFRGVERCLPWIDRVHFVTWGHLPAWLNTDHPKLHIVNHKDYIPAPCLPTFSSHPIELNLHRIDSLAQQFIYTNDDFFFLKPMPERFFFRDGLPVDAGLQTILQFVRPDGIDHIVANNLQCINAHFDKSKVMKEQKSKWFHPSYRKGLIKNLYLKPLQYFTGFYDPHLPQAYLKSTLAEVWERSPAPLERTSSHRVRSNEDVNQWLFRYWQLVSGRFSPASPDRGRFLVIGRDDEAIKKVLSNPDTPMLCLSDDAEEIDFLTEQQFLTACFEGLFPQRSAFER